MDLVNIAVSRGGLYQGLFRQVIAKITIMFIALLVQLFCVSECNKNKLTLVFCFVLHFHIS